MNEFIKRFSGLVKETISGFDLIVFKLKGIQIRIIAAYCYPLRKTEYAGKEADYQFNMSEFELETWKTSS